MEQEVQQCYLDEDLRQDLEEISRSLYAVANAVSRLPGADESLARGMADTIAIISWRIDALLPNDNAAIVA